MGACRWLGRVRLRRMCERSSPSPTVARWHATRQRYPCIARMMRSRRAPVGSAASPSHPGHPVTECPGRQCQWAVTWAMAGRAAGALPVKWQVGRSTEGRRLQSFDPNPRSRCQQRLRKSVLSERLGLASSAFVQRCTSQRRTRRGDRGIVGRGCTRSFRSQRAGALWKASRRSVGSRPPQLNRQVTVLQLTSKRLHHACRRSPRQSRLHPSPR